MRFSSLYLLAAAIGASSSISSSSGISSSGSSSVSSSGEAVTSTYTVTSTLGSLTSSSASSSSSSSSSASASSSSSSLSSISASSSSSASTTSSSSATTTSLSSASTTSSSSSLSSSSAITTSSISSPSSSSALTTSSISSPSSSSTLSSSSALTTTTTTSSASSSSSSVSSTSSTAVAESTVKPRPMLFRIFAAAKCSGASEVAKDVLFGYWKGTKTNENKKNALNALNDLKNWLNDFPERGSFKYLKGNISGYMWVGSMVQNSGFSSGDAIKALYDEINKNGMPNMVYMEYVDSDPMKTFGITLNTGGSKKVGDCQRAVKLWSQGKKYDTNTGTKNWKGKAVCYLDYNKRKAVTNDEEAGKCDVVRAKTGENPAKTANVNGESLQIYNPTLDFNKLAVNAEFCKSVGKLQSSKPKKNADGSCHSYLVQNNDRCDRIAAKYSLTVEEIESLNKKTWGWYGCGALKAQGLICLSDGTPPPPKTIEGAQCGPLAPGKLNGAECPLNACCSQYGYCGVGPAYCDKRSSSTGNPGTTGCQSNCGEGKIHTSQANTFRNIVYWMDLEGALAMNPKDLDNGNYDTIHYGFVNIGSNLKVDESSMLNADFFKVKMKKVASFGGWDFSTNPKTYKIFRDIVSTATTRENFANNVVDFLKKKGLDGIDLDWEYPGAVDMEGIPDDAKDSGTKYLDLLKRIKGKLPSGKTLSVAIPASYYFLQNFPIKDMQSYVNYFVLMAYDYQDGDTLQCHADQEWIISSLKLLDKAGVKMWRVAGGVANYGRSYKLKDKKCTKIGCASNGLGAKRSGTNTPGFLADFELNEIAKSKSKNSRSTDNKSNCDIMVYDNDNWVAWPKASQRTKLQQYYKEHALGGTVTWAGNYIAHSKY